MQVRQNILSGKVSFDEPIWSSVSDLAKDFINGLLCLDPKERPSTDEARQHPWILLMKRNSSLGEEESKLDSNVVTELKKYKEYSHTMKFLCEVISFTLQPDQISGLREEFEKLDVQMNQEKTRTVDLSRDETFSFLGFDYRRVRTRRGVWGVRVTPRMKARTALLRELKEAFRCHQSQPVDRVIYLINPILRGWVNYFRVGNSSECFGYIKDWVEKKIRRHLMRARKRRGFGWNRWSRAWFYETLGLFNDYGVRHYRV